jgi:putative CocE/NonD family hydrolase
VRGSGASYGFRSFPYSHEEIKDGAEIADWITSQPWSNGSIGAWGNSYAGGSAVLLLTNNHPAVKAVMPRYAMFDLYTDVIFPGGVQLNWFTETWGSLTSAMDKNSIEEFLGLKAKIAVKGIRPVDNDPDLLMLEDAVTGHAANIQITDFISDITYRDDESLEFPGITIDHISPHKRLDEINRSDAAVYMYTGWYDASFVLSAIKYYIYLDDPKKKLTIGPWDHGGWHNISPSAERDRVFFDSNAEMLRFFDYHLKGVDTGIYSEESVHYFTMGEDKWKSSSTWPPQGTEKVLYYLAGHNSLVLNAPEYSSGSDLYEVDYTTGTGNSSRWNSLVNLSHKPIFYPDRREEDNKLLCYTTAPLKNDTEVTGHPEVTLYVSSTAEDGNFFVYLEDVDPEGRVTYVTEGILRMLHSRQSNNTPPCSTVVPCRTYKSEDAFVLGSGEIAELVFSLFPTSYLFKKDHSIRISLAGADKDHFVFNPKEPPVVCFYRNRNNASYIALPIVKNHQ